MSCVNKQTHCDDVKDADVDETLAQSEGSKKTSKKKAATNTAWVMYLHFLVANFMVTSFACLLVKVFVFIDTNFFVEIVDMRLLRPDDSGS